MPSANPYDAVEEKFSSGQGGALPSPAPATTAPAAITENPNPYDAVEQQVQDTHRAVARSATTMAPAQAGEAVRLARETGLGLDLVSRQLEQVGKEVETQRIAGFLQRSPQLASWMQDGVRASMVKDDVKYLSLAEELFGRWEKQPLSRLREEGGFGMSFDDPNDPNAGALRMTQAPILAQRFAQGIAELRASLFTNREAKAEAQKDDQGKLGTPGQRLADVFTYPLQLLGLAQPRAVAPGQDQGPLGIPRARPLSAEEEAQRAELEAQAGRKVESATPVGTGLGAVGHALPMLAAGAGATLVGGLAGGAPGAVAADVGLWRSLNFAGPYRQLRDLRAADGTALLSEAEARTYANAAAWGTAIAQTAGGALFMRGLPGAKEALDKVFGDSVARTVADASWRPAAGRFLAEYGTHFASGVTLMLAQAAGESAVVELAKSNHGADPDWMNVGRAVRAQVGEAAIVAGLLGAWAPTRELVSEAGRVHSVRAQVAQLDSILQTTKATKLAQTHPEEAVRLLGRLAQDGRDLQTVFIDRQALDELALSKGLDPSTLAARLTGNPDAYAQAFQSGARLAAPVERYAVEATRTGLAESLREHVSLSQDGLTLAQDKARAEMVNRAVERLRALKADQMEAGQRAVYEDFRQKALLGGRKNAEADAVARLTSAFFAAQAERVGTTPEELYRRMADVRIVRGEDGTPTAEPMARAAKLEQTALDPERFPSARDITPEEARLARARWDSLTQDQRDILWNHPDGNGIPADLEVRLKEIADEKATLGRRYYRSTLFEQPLDRGTLRLNKEGERGYIEFSMPGGDGPRRFDIHLLDRADRSTLAHETAHFLGEVFGDLARAKDAPDQLKFDHDALARWMGYASGDERLAAAKERGDLTALAERTPEQAARLRELTTREEKLSHAWEQYLMEGKAPSRELAPVFLRFRNWMLAIYRGIQGLAEQFAGTFGKPLELNDDVRKVFDRMLVAEPEVAVAEKSAGLRRLDSLAEKLTPAERASYDQALAEEQLASREAMVARLAEQTSKENRGWFKEEHDRIRGEVEQELRSQPVFRARRYLESGEFLGADGKALELARPEDAEGNPLKLSRRAIVDRYGKDFADTLPRAWLRKDGAHPDFLAESLGFGSGDEMIRALQASQPFDRAAETETLRRLREAHPDLVENPQGLAAEALDAVHTSKAAARMLTELRLMARRLEPALEPRLRLVSPETVRAAAQRLVEQSRVGDVSPGRFLRAERDAAERAFELLDKGKVGEAFDAKEQQLVSHFAWKFAKDAQAETDSAVSALRRFTDDGARAELGKAGPEYLAQVDNLLDGFELRGSVSRQEVGRRLATQTWIANEQAAGRDPIIPDTVLRNLDRMVHWKELTLTELRDLRDSVENVAHLADLKNTIMDGQKRRDFTAARQELIDTALASKPTMPVRTQESAASFTERTAKKLRGYGYALAKVEEIVRQLDGGKVDGPWSRLVWNPVVDGDLQRLKLVRDTVQPILDVLHKLPDEDLKRWQETTFTVNGEQYNLQAAVAVALNWGNASNRQKLLEGWRHESVERRGVKPWGDNTHKEFLDRLTSRDWQLVQTIWNSLESLWPQASALEQKLTGLAPPKVKPEAFTWHAADGVEVKLEGGYFPVVYDPRFSKAGAAGQEATDLRSVQLFNSDYYRAATPQGHLQERVEGFVRPIALDNVLNLIPKKVNETAKDIAMREGLLSAHKLLTDDQVRAALQKTIGTEGEKALLGWLRDVANDLSIPDNGGTAAWTAALGKLRSNLTAGIFAYNVGQTLQNIAGVIPAVREVGAGHFAGALQEIARDRAGSLDFIYGKSAEMRERSMSGHAGVADALRELAQKEGLGARFTEFGLAIFESTDKAVAIPTWLAAYRKALAGGVDDATAVRTADRTVRLKLMSGSNVNLPAMLRSPIGKLFAPLMGFAVNRANQIWASISDARVANDDGLRWTAAKLIGGTLAAVMLEGIASELVTGKGPKDENDDGEIDATDWAIWVSRTAALSVPKLIPVVGTMIRAGESGRDASFNPEARVLTSMAKTLDVPRKLAKASENDALDENAMLDAAGQVLETVGYAKGLPVAQASATAKFLRRWHDDREQPQSVGEAALGVTYGPKRPGKLSNLIYAE